MRGGSWWSRTWGLVALVAFALHLGAALYEATVIAPLWTSSPPDSVTAWASSPLRVDSSGLFHPLVSLLLTATTIAWISSLTTPGRRRWWLTLAEGCALGLAWIVIVDLIPLERGLFSAAAVLERAAVGADPAVVASTGDWVRAAALRLAALTLGAFAAHRAHLAGLPAGVATAGVDDDFVFPAARAERGRRSATGRPARDFSLGDDEDEEEFVVDEAAAPRSRRDKTSPPRSSRGKAATPRSRWMGSIPRSR
jgi:hypothetical protein